MARQRAAAARCISPRHRLASGRASRIGMKVAIRDDDTSYFTTPEALDRVYGDVWDRIPVCLAVVPFAIGYEQPGIPREHWHSDRKSTRLNSSHTVISYAVFCLKKKKDIANNGIA